jgi:hypothetical protein
MVDYGIYGCGKVEFEWTRFKSVLNHIHEFDTFPGEIKNTRMSVCKSFVTEIDSLDVIWQDELKRRSGMELGDINSVKDVLLGTDKSQEREIPQWQWNNSEMLYKKLESRLEQLNLNPRAENEGKPFISIPLELELHSLMSSVECLHPPRQPSNSIVPKLLQNIKSNPNAQLPLASSQEMFAEIDDNDLEGFCSDDDLQELDEQEWHGPETPVNTVKQYSRGDTLESMDLAAKVDDFTPSLADYGDDDFPPSPTPGSVESRLQVESLHSLSCSTNDLQIIDHRIAIVNEKLSPLYKVKDDAGISWKDSSMIPTEILIEYHKIHVELGNLEKEFPQIPQYDGAGEELPMEKFKVPKQKSKMNAKTTLKSKKRRVRFDLDLEFETSIQGVKQTVNDPDGLPLGLLSGLENVWSPITERESKAWFFYHDPPKAWSPTDDFAQFELDQMHIDNHKEMIAKDDSEIENHVTNSMISVENRNDVGFSDKHCSENIVNTKFYRYAVEPPVIGPEEILKTNTVFFSNPADVPRARVFAGRLTEHKSQSIVHLEAFQHPPELYHGIGNRVFEPRFKRRLCTFARPPPTAKSLYETISRPSVSKSQLDGPTPKKSAFTDSSPELENDQDDSMTIMSVELYHECNGDYGDPNVDSVIALFYSIEKAVSSSRNIENGCIMIQDSIISNVNRLALRSTKVQLVKDEKALFAMLVGITQSVNPDIMVGYDVQKASWGYLAQRSHLIYGVDLFAAISRTQDNINTKWEREDDEWGARKQSSLHVAGRIVLNVWRLMRKQLATTSYTFESMIWQVLQERVPRYAGTELKRMYNSNMSSRLQVLKYYLKRSQGNIDLLYKTEIISQTWYCCFDKVSFPKHVGSPFMKH